MSESFILILFLIFLSYLAVFISYFYHYLIHYRAFYSIKSVCLCSCSLSFIPIYLLSPSLIFFSPVSSISKFTYHLSSTFVVYSSSLSFYLLLFSSSPLLTTFCILPAFHYFTSPILSIYSLSNLSHIQHLLSPLSPFPQTTTTSCSPFSLSSLPLPICSK